MVKGNERDTLLTIYDTIFLFGSKPWGRVDWRRAFAPLTQPTSVEKRLARLDKFCDKWEIPIEKWSVKQPTFTQFRQFTPASKRRVDKLLGPILQEPEPPQQDVLREALAGATTPYEGVTGRGLRNASVGQEG